MLPQRSHVLNAISRKTVDPLPPARNASSFFYANIYSSSSSSSASSVVWAIRSKSRWPDCVMRRPPLSSSCSRTPIFSRACMTLRSTEPEASVWWEGREPRFLVALRRPLILPSSQLPTRMCIFVPVCLAETANTDGLAHVDVASDSGCADVEPVDVLGRQLLGVYASLDMRH